jgi:hypothetical protein
MLAMSTDANSNSSSHQNSWLAIQLFKQGHVEMNEQTTKRNVNEGQRLRSGSLDITLYIPHASEKIRKFRVIAIEAIFD